MNFLDLKRRTRTAVHSAFEVPCLLARGARDGIGDIPLTARFHNRMGLTGDLQSQGYAEIIEGIQRVVLNRELLATALDGGELTLVRGDIITFPDYIAIGTDLTLMLDARDPYDGPVTERWAVGAP